MSNPSATPYFLVYAPYCTDPDVLVRRAAARSGHLEHLGPLTEAGIIRVGGIMAELVDERSPNPVGSSMIVKMGSISEVRKMLKEDIYYIANIWDKEKLVVVQFIPAVPLP